jgi:hypothetical protein
VFPVFIFLHNSLAKWAGSYLHSLLFRKWTRISRHPTSLSCHQIRRPAYLPEKLNERFSPYNHFRCLRRLFACVRQPCDRIWKKAGKAQGYPSKEARRQAKAEAKCSAGS